MILVSGPIFVHSDSARGLLAARRLGQEIRKAPLSNYLLAFLASLTDAQEDGLLFPAFNYDYGRTRSFDVQNDPVQVGALPEWIRCNAGFQRTEVPFFSFLSKIDLGITSGETINPFGPASGFHWLVQKDASVMFFGAAFGTLTFIHYIEEVCGKPLYRYDKSFPGTIIDDGVSRPCDFQMHVRPLGLHVDYDWPRLEKELLQIGMLKVSDLSSDIKWINARALLEFWGNKIADDPFYLLDEKSRAQLITPTHGGKKRIELEDFEGH